MLRSAVAGAISKRRTQRHHKIINLCALKHWHSSSMPCLCDVNMLLTTQKRRQKEGDPKLFKNGSDRPTPKWTKCDLSHLTPILWAIGESVSQCSDLCWKFWVSLGWGLSGLWKESWHGPNSLTSRRAQRPAASVWSNSKAWVARHYFTWTITSCHQLIRVWVTGSSPWCWPCAMRGVYKPARTCESGLSWNDEARPLLILDPPPNLDYHALLLGFHKHKLLQPISRLNLLVGRRMLHTIPAESITK